MSTAPSGPRRAARTVAVAAVLLVIGVIVLAAVLLSGGNDERTPGPIQAEEGNELGASVPVGREFMYGVPVIFNGGDEPATLEAARYVSPTPGLKVVKTYVAGPRREANYVAGSRSWPAKSVTDLKPLAGYEVAPRKHAGGRRGVELVLVMRVARPGRYITRGVELDYEVGGSRHRRAMPNSFAACAFREAGRKLIERDCKLPPVSPVRL